MYFRNIPQPGAVPSGLASGSETGEKRLPLTALVADGPVLTDRGTLRACDLQPGDRISPPGLDPAIVTGLCVTEFSADQLYDTPGLRPIRIDAGAFGPGSPAQAQLVAPGQPVRRPPCPYGLPTTTPAKAYTLCNGGSIRPVIPAEGIRYVEVTCAPADSPATKVA